MKAYSQETRAEALELMATHGVTEVARRTGIAKGTLSKWAKAAGVETVMHPQTKAATEAAMNHRAARRERIRDLLLEKAEDILGSLQGSGSAHGNKENATAAAILLDKFRLEMGEPTARQEVAVADARGRIETIVDELASRRRPA